jgi:AcrR family transcriptional regulator
MPRHPDPDLEDRIVCAADVLWRRGGEKALTMRAVAEAAGTNTPAVYRRFKNRQALVRALMLRIVARIREEFEQKETPEETAEAYVEYALRNRNEYLLFYSHAWALNPPRGRRGPRPIRESRPNFAFTEKLLAKELGGSPKDHTQLVIALWAMLHGTAMLLLNKSFPEGHEEELRIACRAAVKTLIQSHRRGTRDK